MLREVQVGAHAVTNVTASISPVQGEPLLVQSFLSKFGTVTFDYNRLVLILARLFGRKAVVQAHGFDVIHASGFY